MNEKRFAIVLFGLAVAVAVGYLAVQFVAALTVSVFLYYSTRRYYRFLGRLRLPARLRAGVVLASLAVPLLLLISYTAALLIQEAGRFIEQYGVVGVVSQRVSWFGGVSELPELTVQGLYGAYQAGQLDGFITFAEANATFLTNLVSGFLLNLFIVVIVTYSLLVDGHRIREWLLRFDDEAIVREYLEAVDAELEAVLFGNLLNVIATSLIAVAVYHGYNFWAPAPADIPYPALAGALTGIASLIPVVGMKIVYIPVTAIAAAGIVLGANNAFLVYILVFLVLAVVVVDTIPDIVLRPLLSGENTHVGLLMLAYTLGPVVLGFYGLFFAPILLVVALTFADTALPRLLGADPAEAEDGLHRDQLRLDQFR
jgi:predicted PurR-regulated permease PerM